VLAALWLAGSLKLHPNDGQAFRLVTKELLNANGPLHYVTNNDKASTPNKPTTDTRVSIIDQDLIVSFNDS
jgi:hypothetical protein